MSARVRNQKVENPSRENGAEKPKITRDRQKPRYYRKKSRTLELYYSDKGIFLADRANKRQVRAENAQLKWEIRISKLLG